MTSEQRRTAALVARELTAQAVEILRRAHEQLKLAAPSGHDVTSSSEDATRAADVSRAKIDLLLRRIPA